MTLITLEDKHVDIEMGENPYNRLGPKIVVNVQPKASIHQWIYDHQVPAEALIERPSVKTRFYNQATNSMVNTKHMKQWMLDLDESKLTEFKKAFR
jgi:hypothetical protein